MRTVVVFVREPGAGRVKSRLARDLGTVGAAWWYRHQTRRLLRGLGRDTRFRTILAVTPDRAAATRALPGGVARIAQGPGDLGARMARALTLPGTVLVVGSDIPALTPDAVIDAFRALGSADFVFGPASDGGYWAVGRRGGATLPPRALAAVRWSTPHALEDSVRSLRHYRIAYARRLRDVDMLADLREGGPSRGS